MAAERLIKILEPWGVRCKVMDLDKAAKSRSLTEEEAATWCGLAYAPSKAIKPGDANPPALVGFAVQGPVVLLGTPEDNPIIGFLGTLRVTDDKGTVLAEQQMPQDVTALLWDGDVLVIGLADGRVLGLKAP